MSHGGSTGHCANEEMALGALIERPVKGSALSAQSQPRWTDRWQEPQALGVGEAFCSLYLNPHVLKAYALGSKGSAVEEGNFTNHTPGALGICVASAVPSLLSCKMRLSRAYLS